MELNYQDNDINTANLYLNSQRVSQISKLTPCVVNITRFNSVERERVEHFIKDIYREKYSANIQVDYPILMSVRNEYDEILAAVGFRFANNHRLFLEQYLESPIEFALNSQRKKIVEIGNLASAGKGASVFLFAALASFLNYNGINYAAITGTDYLHRYFVKIGLKPTHLADADVSSLLEGSENWGTYYEQKPRVLVGNVQTGIKKLNRLFGAKYTPCSPPLRTRLHYRQKGGL
ncbi:hypothetical protein GCM10011403_23950 [Pseudohongiella nitratireducens]|uniref:Thermostable hemolysin n=1 Tax=Pseudohongiella nitratireducens TaxID=1768907 RepID=A0A916QKJ6_9GAMM|nr:thermostable hemolysin [Pseudohongiella nitratireducens]MDF1623948.1 thermostable hemolysin [Pseudohongiella nitratireducens]GFZ80048.1 hypothetical protein GCM10011403_23950 [Pseudohongiella nitratireducens]|tara:strand:- start:9627 stop:10328 length:702 start_codon:yes stop_codon:yes gene_type:complete